MQPNGLGRKPGSTLSLLGILSNLLTCLGPRVPHLLNGFMRRKMHRKGMGQCWAGEGTREVLAITLRVPHGPLAPQSKACVCTVAIGSPVPAVPGVLVE